PSRQILRLKGIIAVNVPLARISQSKVSFAASDVPIEKLSLSRGLVMNKFEKDFMIYPEYTDTDDVKAIQGFTEILRKSLNLTVDHEELEKLGTLSDAVIGALNDSAVFAALAPSEYGGLGLGFKDRVKIFEELSVDWNIYANVVVMNALTNTLILFGSEELKQKYFPLIASGKCRPVVALVRDELVSSHCLPLAAATVGYSKRLLNDLAAFCNKTSSPRQQSTTEFALKVQSLNFYSILHLMTICGSELTVQVYALESASYYLSGLLDEGLPVVLDIENALLHRLTRDVLRSSVFTCVDLAGLRAINPAFHFEKDIRDVTTLLSLVGAFLVATVIVTFRITNALKRLFRQEKLEDELRHPKLTHYIAEHAHPSLQMACQDLEFSMSRVNNVISKLMSEKGKNVQHDFASLERLVTIIQNHLVMTAVISRSSRSYSIGLRNSDIEIAWATFICSKVSRENWFLLEALNDYYGLIRLNPSLLNVGKAVFDMGGYQIESPIERNW
ncbi:unnamed protein product, partial [Haemonchus placei]|uniref:Acyl-CoA_dh_N domain-containing protein n=1 Tax=Haemonchus placei TaxID=6290 RepID=A0A158QP65_HAEPC